MIPIAVNRIGDSFDAAGPPSRHPDRREDRGGYEDERAWQDLGEKPAREPELLRPDSHLVEEKRRQCRDHQNQRRRPPERSPHDQRIADQGEDERGAREIQVREHANGMRVVGSQPAARLAQEERVQAADRHARDQRDRQDRVNRADTRGRRLAQIRAHAATAASANAAS